MAEQILHFGAITARLNGTGLFRMELFNLDDTAPSTLVPFTMATSPGKEPTRLCNFVQQRARLKMFTTDIDDYFKVNRVVVFVKPIYTQYPGTE
jgi:hypothetical protein